MNNMMASNKQKEHHLMHNLEIIKMHKLQKIKNIYISEKNSLVSCRKNWNPRLNVVETYIKQVKSIAPSRREIMKNVKFIEVLKSKELSGEITAVIGRLNA